MVGSQNGLAGVYVQDLVTVAMLTGTVIVQTQHECMVDNLVMEIVK